MQTVICLISMTLMMMVVVVMVVDGCGNGGRW